MSKRLQVIFEESEYGEIEEAARRERMTVSEWVRQSLRAARCQEPGRGAAEKLTAVRQAVGHSFPTADIDQILEEIENGYLGGAR